MGDRGHPANAGDDDLVISAHAVEALLQFSPKRIRAIHCWAADPRVLARIEPLIARHAIVRIDQPPREIGGAAALAQGIAARVSPYEYADLDDVLPVNQIPDETLLVVLDSVTDPRNLGAILRSAAFYKATAVILPQDRAAGVTPLVERISRGGSAALPVVQVVNLARTLRSLADRGVRTVGTVLHGATVDLWELDWQGPTAIVLGAEDSGLRPLVRKQCETLATTAGSDAMGSLNVASFATLALAIARRPR